MLEWFVLIVLLLLGVGLIVAEIILVPGTTFVGILGAVLLVVGVYLSFRWMGPFVGWWIVAGVILSVALSIFYGLRNDTWNRFSLNSRIDSRVNEEFPLPVQVGQLGQTVSQLRPQGKAEFNDQVLEVRTLGEFLPVGTHVRISRINGHIVFVESTEVYQA